MRIDECLGKLREVAGNLKSASPEDIPLVTQFTQALDDDLNIAAAWGAIFEWITETNRRLADNRMDAASAASALAAWNRMDSVLGVGAPSEVEVPEEINALMGSREVARKAKDFKRSDAIRDEIKAKGWVIEDTPKVRARSDCEMKGLFITFEGTEGSGKSTQISLLAEHLHSLGHPVKTFREPGELRSGKKFAIR